MNRNRAKELLPLIQAFADGKIIQYHSFEKGVWYDLDEPIWGEGGEYRIKPEPKLRPWKPGEIPLGAWIRRKGVQPSWRAIIGYVTQCGQMMCCGISFGLDHAFTYCEHSIDHGKTWLPCGVMEE